MFNGKSILITGGTGSFGQQLTKTLLARFDLARLVIYSRDELKQYEMEQQFSGSMMRCFYVIQPSIQMFRHVSYSTNGLNERSKHVCEGFQYCSGSNTHFLTVEELSELNGQVAS